jgi:hypothetical protein
MKKILFCNHIPKDQVLSLAIKLVKKAEAEIVVSHSPTEVSTVSPSDKYYQTLQNKIAAGIKVTRYFFGDKKFFKKDKNNNLEISYVFAGNKNYFQRMIIIDQKKALFKMNTDFFYTEFLPLIKALMDYCSFHTHLD